MTRRTFIRLFAVGFVARFCHEMSNNDDSEGTL